MTMCYGRSTVISESNGIKAKSNRSCNHRLIQNLLGIRHVFLVLDTGFVFSFASL